VRQGGGWSAGAEVATTDAASRASSELLYKSTFPMEFRAGVFGDRLIWHKARPESPVPGESPLAILAFPTGHSWVT